MVKPDEFGTLIIEKSSITPSRQRKLDALTDFLGTSDTFTNDPIKYIQTHYDGDETLGIEEKELKELWTLLKDKGMDYASPDGLHKFLVVLGIKFRPNTAKTKKGLNVLEKNESNKVIMVNNLAEFNHAVFSVLGAHHEPIGISFDFEHYDSLQKPIDKVLYLLNLSKSNLRSISDISHLGGQAIMTAINTKLEEILLNLRSKGFEIDDIKISKGSINNLLNKLNT